MSAERDRRPMYRRTSPETATDSEPPPPLPAHRSHGHLIAHTDNSTPPRTSLTPRESSTSQASYSPMVSNVPRFQGPAPIPPLRLVRQAEQAQQNSGERIEPIEPGETGEIGIRAAQRQSVLYGKSCQVGIGNEIAGGLSPGQQIGENLPVMLSRLRNPDTRNAEPFVNLVPGAVDRQGLSEQTGIRRQTQERKQRRPWQTNAAR